MLSLLVLLLSEAWEMNGDKGAYAPPPLSKVWGAQVVPQPPYIFAAKYHVFGCLLCGATESSYKNNSPEISTAKNSAIVLTSMPTLHDLSKSKLSEKVYIRQTLNRNMTNGIICCMGESFGRI